MLSAATLAQWQRPVPSSEDLDLLHRAIYAVLTGALPRPSKWPAKLVHFFVLVSFPVAPAAAGAIQSR
jgi:hypothetical protein